VPVSRIIGSQWFWECQYSSFGMTPLITWYDFGEVQAVAVRGLDALQDESAKRWPDNYPVQSSSTQPQISPLSYLT
jgi:hypothetical protein